jgi:DNA mismatch repair protein MutL
MDTIAILPDAVADQIAAGEVLEQPASAVKELIENALDAGATHIRIEIEGGGLQKITVEDDGRGMSFNDATLCLRRHATSKIRSADDLQRLITKGFRGEALAAISAVSIVELRTSDGQQAVRVQCEGGGAIRVDPAARNRGTTIEVRSLFFNTPARLKFQKSPSSCAAAVLKAVQTISLAHPDTDFILLSNGKTTFQCMRSSWRQRAEDILGPFPHLVEAQESGLSLRALIAAPSDAKVTRSGQFLFVNSRPIVSPLVGRAVKEGFGTRIGAQFFPQFLLFLDLSPDEIDVNVHPQKKEIRFQNEGKIFNIIRRAIASAFETKTESIAPIAWDFIPASAAPFVFADAPIVAEAPSLPYSEPARSIALLGDFLLLEEAPWKLVDLRGAEARVLFERMSHKESAKQPLLWPLEISLGIGEEAENVAAVLHEIGIEARPVGPRQLAVDALPSGMPTEAALPFVEQYLRAKHERRLAASLTRVCRASSRKFSLEEATRLWRQLQQCADPHYDPLGKKIVALLTEDHWAEFFS